MPYKGYPISNVEGGTEVLEMSNREIRDDLISIARAMNMQSNYNMMLRV